MAKVFKEMNDFKPSETLFISKKAEMITNLKNKLMAEPYMRTIDYYQDLLNSNRLSIEDTIKETEKLTFEQFKTL